MAQNQAAWLDAPGKGLRVDSAEMPKVTPGSILVRNRAVAINPLDCMSYVKSAKRYANLP